MEKLEMTGRQMLRVWGGLRLEWLLCPLNLEKKSWREPKSNISDQSDSSSVPVTNEQMCQHF